MSKDSVEILVAIVGCLIGLGGAIAGESSCKGDEPRQGSAAGAGALPMWSVRSAGAIGRWGGMRSRVMEM